MDLLDMRTVLIGYALSNAICAAVMFSLWSVNRRRSAGLGFWLADFIMQFVAVVLVLLRGTVPVPVSIFAGSPLIIAGTALLFVGLERHTGKTGRQLHNVALFGVFLAAHAYFTFAYPSLVARNVNLSLALLALCLQFVWLLVRRVDAEMQPHTRMTALIFGAYAVFSAIRVYVDLTRSVADDIFASGFYDVLVVMVYQMLFIGLTFSLFLLVNRRLVAALERDIVQRAQVEEALRQSEEKFALAFRTSPYAITITRMSDGKFIDLNEAFLRITGYTRDEAANATSLEMDLWFDEDDRKRVIANLSSGGKVVGEEFRFKANNGRIVTGLFSADAFLLGGERYILSSIADITDRAVLEEQLRQAQKMESVGRLAGGVAHEFNNMLSVILGYTEMALNRVDGSDPLHDELGEVFKAAERSAEVTRQLLAFARKQTVLPQLLDINGAMQGMLKMLRRLIGEDVDLDWIPGEGLWPVMIDPSQVDQILANLCVNARDAIGGVGTITIQTENVTVDESFSADHDGSVPGEYVALAVRDDGAGMDAATLENLFEPFFTTKGVGEGTGLGLATVYGVVRQNGGFIDVESESGRGTTITIYLPRYAGTVALAQEGSPGGMPWGRGETVLVVEDEMAILNLSKRMLERLGYASLTAATPVEAVGVARDHPGEIHLLLTDVVMPGMNGRELSETLRSQYPALRSLFMSGFTGNVIAHRGIVDEGLHFLQKPFSLNDLAVKVRESLDEE